MEYCAYCGNPLNEEQRYCQNCGSVNPGYREPVSSEGVPYSQAPEQSFEQTVYGDPFASPARYERGTNGLAIAGFACAFIAPLVGLILSIVAGKRAESGEYENPLAGLAKWGKIVSIIGIVLGVIIISLYVFGIIYAVNNGGSIEWDELEDIFDTIKYSY